jgi:hypothetical protein
VAEHAPAAAASAATAQSVPVAEGDAAGLAERAVATGVAAVPILVHEEVVVMMVVAEVTEEVMHAHGGSRYIGLVK